MVDTAAAAVTVAAAWGGAEIGWGRVRVRKEELERRRDDAE